MKTNYILTVLALCFCLNTTAQMANSKGGDDPWDNLQNTFNESFPKDASDVLNKLSRWYWLRKNDIRIWMDVKYEEQTTNYMLIFETIDEHDASMYVEFDWDNKALMMEGKTYANKSGYGVVVAEDLGVRLWEKDNPEETIIQYTDKEGNWYVPVETPPVGMSYIKFNAKQMAVNSLNNIFDLVFDITSNKLAAELIGIASLVDFDSLSLGSIMQFLIDIEDGGDEYLESLENLGDLIIQKNQERLADLINQILEEEFTKDVGLPVFIHWALMYSPEVIKAKETVTESKVTFAGNPNCTKLTVTSFGENKGKSMVFDEYDRLVFIDALKEGTARFAYDRDVTVKLPAASDMSDIMKNIMNPENSELKNEEILDAIKKKKEKLERENAKKEEILEYIKKEIRELEVKKEQAISKKDREEYQEIIDELKDILKKESN